MVKYEERVNRMGRPRQFVENDVIASASRAFSDNGYGGTTIDDLVVATGLGKQSLYNAFGGKRELFLRALTATADVAVRAVDEALAGGDSTPLQRIRAQVLRLAITFSDESAGESLFTKATVELGDRDAEVAHTALAALENLEGSYERCIRDAQGCGELDPAADARAFAALFVAVTRGMEVMGKAGASRAKLTAVAEASLESLPLTDAATPAQ
jgi:TetR/AcrR family transcriptional repressor of nem operon